MTSQGHEDVRLGRIFEAIGTTTRYAVEIGARDGVTGSNTHAFERAGWTRLLLDRVPKGRGVHRVHVTAENINAIFASFHVPSVVDLLSIDVDGNDFHLWRALTVCTPRVVVIEYNSSFGPEDSLVIPYQPRHQWDRTDYYGASAAALVKLGREKGYTLVDVEPRTNLFFVHDSLVTGRLLPQAVPPAAPYGYPPSGQPWEAY